MMQLFYEEFYMVSGKKDKYWQLKTSNSNLSDLMLTITSTQILCRWVPTRPWPIVRTRRRSSASCPSSPMHRPRRPWEAEEGGRGIPFSEVACPLTPLPPAELFSKIDMSIVYQIMHFIFKFFSIGGMSFERDGVEYLNNFSFSIFLGYIIFSVGVL